MNNTLKGYATETWVLKRLSKFKATSSSTSGAQIVGSTHEHANKETLDKLTEEMIKVLSTLSIDENGHLCSSVGLYSQSFVSAFGLNPSSGGSGGGGAASIIVNGNQYTPNADGVITLPDYPTSLTWSNIEGKPSWIGSTKPTYTASEVGALPSNHPASDVTSALIANWNAAYNWGNHASAGYLKSITKTLVVNALGYTPFNNASFTKANIKSTLGISDWALAASKPTYSTSEIVNFIGYTPFNKDSFTKSNIKSTLGISDWALASSKPSYNLDEVADGTSRKLSNYLLKSVFDDLFEKVTENGVTYIKAKYNFASVGFISAFGLNSSADIFEKVTEGSDTYIKANHDIKEDGDILASSMLSFVASQTNISTLSFRGKLRPVTYTKNNNTTSKRIGFVTQEVQSLYPELVQIEHGVTCLDYQSCTAVLAAQVNALSDALDALKQRVDNLEK